MRHHVLLSIVGIHRIGGGTAHYSGKREQERLIEQGRVPWTMSATRFTTLRRWLPAGPSATASPPSRRYRSADRTRRHRSGLGRGRHRGAAGPLRRCRRSRAARPSRHGPPHQRRSRSQGEAGSTWSGPLGAEMAGNVCCPARTPASPRRPLTSGWRPARDRRKRWTPTRRRRTRRPCFRASPRPLCRRTGSDDPEDRLPARRSRHPAAPPPRRALLRLRARGEMVFELQGEPRE